MKKILFFSLIATILFFNGCYMDSSLLLQACFSTDYTTYSINETVYFDNCTTNATSYYWEFGDGSTSRSEFPAHVYQYPGTYTVKLTVYNRHDEDVMTQTVKIESQNTSSNTELNILVLYKGTNDAVANSWVTLYDSQSEWYNFLNPLDSAFTSRNGIAIFSNLSPIEYYIDIYKSANNGYYSNEQLGYITDPLDPGIVNYYDFYIEYIQNSSGKKALKVMKVVKGSPDNPYRIAEREKYILKN